MDAGDSHMTENILWLTRENVEDRTDAVTPMTGMDAMLASGVSVGGVVTDPQATLTQVSPFLAVQWSVTKVVVSQR